MAKNDTTKSGAQSDALSYESALAELESIVARMEAGQLPLEDSLAAYQRGAELLKFCQSKLADAQQKIRLLDADVLKPFTPANE
ncbi:MAG: exodeoxyribonuclease VII small subunit [Burkholderiales bacterium]